MTTLDCAKFLASLPPIQSAIKIYGDDSGMRIQLEVPKDQMGEAVKVVAMGGMVLEVTVKVIPNNTQRTDNDKQRADMAALVAGHNTPV